MSDSPPSGQQNTLSKMDALLKKHRGTGESERDETTAFPPSVREHAPSGAWLPVLTQVIERGTPPVESQVTRSPDPLDPLPPVRHETAPDETPSTAMSDTLAEQLMSELAPRLSEVMEKQVAAELRRNIDQTVSSLLGQLDVNVREIVREAVAEKLKNPRDPAN
ncbi:hypothetical protein [Thiobacillus sp.]